MSSLQETYDQVVAHFDSLIAKNDSLHITDFETKTDSHFDSLMELVSSLSLDPQGKNCYSHTLKVESPPPPPPPPIEVM